MVPRLLGALFFLASQASLSWTVQADSALRGSEGVEPLHDTVPHTLRSRLSTRSSAGNSSSTPWSWSDKTWLLDKNADRRQLRGASSMMRGAGDDMAFVKLTPENLFNATASTSPTPCPFQRLMCKEASNQCPPQGSYTCTKPLLITGVAGSGTHYIATYLDSIAKSFKVSHEAPGPRTDVLVGWTARCPKANKVMKPQLLFNQYGFDRTTVKRGMLNWAYKQVEGSCLYKRVIHIVRHPLKFLSSNLAFGECIECWTLVEQFSVPSISHLTTEARQEMQANRIRLGNGSSRDWPKQTRDRLLRANMIYYVVWNRMIERVADKRYQLENLDLKKLCYEEKLGNSWECGRNAKGFRGSHGGTKLQLSWNMMMEIDEPIAKNLKLLAERYGYFD